MLRILHYIPGFSYGGIESIFFSWNSRLDKDKINFEVLMRTHDDTSIGILKLKEQNIIYYRLHDMSNFFMYMRSVFDFFSKHNNYDILHVHEADPFILFAAKINGIKKIVVHSHTTGYGNGIKEQLRYYDEQIAIRLFADYAFACSDLAANWKYGGLKFKSKDVYFVRNAIDVNKFDYNKLTRQMVREQMNLKEAFVIGHVGRMTTPKNQFFLLDIFKDFIARNPNSVLLFIGDGPDEMLLKSYAEKLNIKSAIRFLGNRSDVDIILQGIDCFLLPSKWEGFPVTMVEAQAAGLPCVVSNVITREADVTENVYRCGLDEPKQAWVDILESIEKTFQRRSVKKKLVNSEFNINGAVKLLTKEYERIAGLET